MFAQLIVLFLVLVSTAAWNADYNRCFPGQYCDKPVVQFGTLDSVQSCVNLCAGQKGYKFASYVPSSKQCLCSATCSDSPVNKNPNVDTFCLNPPKYTNCWSGKYCGPNDQIKTQAGLFAKPADCAAQCAKTNKNFNFFNYVPTSQQCQCVTGCTLIANPNVYSYAINDQTCTATNNNN